MASVPLVAATLAFGIPPSLMSYYPDARAYEQDVNGSSVRVSDYTLERIRDALYCEQVHLSFACVCYLRAHDTAASILLLD